MKNTSSVRVPSNFLAALALVAIICATRTTNLIAQEPDGSQIQGKTAHEVYKNLKVLGDIPATEIHPAMEYITMALGVRCGYCHANGDFTKDDKPQKRTARNMMLMMFALDNTVFNGKMEVTCFTCHRGAPIAAPILGFHAEKAPDGPFAMGIYPASAVPSRKMDSTLAPLPASPSATKGSSQPLPTFDEILAKYISALGGAGAIQKTSTEVEKGSVEMVVPPLRLEAGALPPEPVTVRSAAEIYRKAPDEWVAAVHTSTGLSAEGYDGSSGWLQLPNRTAAETGGELNLLKESAEFVPALHATQNYSRLEVDGTEKIGDRDAYRVIGLRERGVDRFYFDTQTGLLLRSWTSMDSVLGSFPQQTDYENYRDVSGVKIPFTVRESTPEGDRTYQWDQVEINTPVEDSHFARPFPPAAKSPGAIGGPGGAGGSAKP